VNSKPNFTNHPWDGFNWLLAALAFCLTGPARAGTQPSGAIPFSDIGARVTADYQGDALGVTATAEGARLRCGFQKLEGHATPQGMWLESTKPGGGKLRLVATALGRAGLSTLNSQPSTALATTGTVSVDDKLVRFTRPGLTEEYSVSADGVRQDFIIESPPLNPPPSAVLSTLRSTATEDGLRRTGQLLASPKPGDGGSTLNQSAGDLRVELALSGARGEAAAGGVRLTFEGSGRALAYSRLRVEDAMGRELTARLEVLSPDRLAVSVADADATYPVRIDPTFSDADWVSLGSGMGGSYAEVHALAVSGTNLYAGGLFTMAGGVAATKIAKWDGTAWSALGSGLLSGEPYFCVLALAVSGTDLYAGGWFTNAGGVPATNIAKWNGSAWSALGSGVDGMVWALAADGTNLYAGGQFTTAGAVPANYIAKWDGSAWSALGSGIDGRVYALAVSGTNLYAGGNFLTAGEVTVNRIAKWDGSVWSALGSGISGGDWVQALLVSGTDLYAGGGFTHAGGVPASCIAKWDGSNWWPLGSGMPGPGVTFTFVNALAVSGTDLYAGGYFTTAGGVTATNIAKWDGSAWSALGSGVDGWVWALALDGAGHLFVGGAFSLAGTNVSPKIAQANVGSAPTVLASPPTQTAEAGATVILTVDADGEPPPAYQWYCNGTNLLSCTSSDLVLTNMPFSQSGTYTVVITNVFGAVTSGPVILNVIPAVERRRVPGVKVTGEAASVLNVEYADSLSATPNWLPLDTVTLASTSQYCFDLTLPLPPHRYYQAWQTGMPAVMPSLDLHIVPAITVTGSIGGSVRVDAINQFGPIDAWFTLDTVTLTNTSQLYFDVSAWRQPQRL
jgi:hypothetical protein